MLRAELAFRGSASSAGMPWVLGESGQSPSELTLALIWVGDRVLRTQNLCPLPHSVLAESNSLKERRTSALGMNLETLWKSNRKTVVE